ncbi:MAG TPA: hypothetical protein VG034_05760 [Acidimicrobiia bacterium]|jgi:hypothetical protein|nr:hypothetical protein [Acidimicrobiia bacterium]
MKPHRLAVYGLAAGLLGGGAAGLALTGTTLASAQVSDVTGTVTDSTATTDSTAADSGVTSTTEAPSTTSSDPGTTTTDPATPATPAPAAGSAKGDWAKSVLDGLVAKGTITPAQADEILAALNAARPAHGPGGRGPGRGGFGKLDAAAQALGMSVEDLRSALEGGKTLAAVAKEKGIDVAKVVDALVAEFKAHLDQEVASGIHTQAEADQKLADARTRIEAFVNGTAPAGGPGGFGGPGGPHGHGPGFGGPPPAGSAPSGGSTSGTTTS